MIIDQSEKTFIQIVQKIMIEKEKLVKSKQTRVKNVWHFIDYTSSVVSYKKSEFDLKPRLAVITEDE